MVEKALDEIVDVHERYKNFAVLTQSQASFFYLVPQVKISAIAVKAKINPSLMRQYATGKATVSEERLKHIQRTIHELGRELQSVAF